MLSLRTSSFRETQWLAAVLDREFRNVISSMKKYKKSEDIQRISFACLKLVLGRCLHELKLVRRIEAGHMLLATAACLAKAQEKRKNSCRFGVHSENLGYAYFFY
jgi:hypothetical protein